MKTAAIAACVVFGLCVSLVAGESGSPSHIAPNVDLTTNLLSAREGSWTRRHAPNSNTYTTHVHTVADDGIILQAIHTHEGHVRTNILYAVPYSYLREHAIDPEAGGAVDRNVEYKGEMFKTRAVAARINDSPGLFFITDEIPATGILGVEISPSNGASPYMLWTDAFGTRPDRLIIEAGPGEPSTGRFGIPGADAEEQAPGEPPGHPSRQRRIPG